MAEKFEVKTERDLAKVMKKIAHLRELASAERGATESEVEVAAAKMAELLLRHNLSTSDIDAFAEKSGRRVVEESVEFRANRWRQMLLFSVARAHLCQAVRHTGAWDVKSHHCRMTVVGHEHNLITVRETWQWLQREVERQGKIELKAEIEMGSWCAKHKSETWVTDFQHGAVAGIEEQYRRMRARVQAEVGQRWGLVPVLEGEVTQRMSELFPETGKMSRSKRPETDGYSAGVAAGLGVNLDRQVGSGRSGAAALRA